MSFAAIGRRYGVSRQAIHAVVRRARYAETVLRKARGMR